VIFGGRIVDEVSGADADEPSLLRAAYNLRADAALPETAAGLAVAEAVGLMDVAGSPATAEAADGSPGPDGTPGAMPGTEP
jgi:hypothetical protein